MNTSARLWDMKLYRSLTVVTQSASLKPAGVIHVPSVMIELSPFWMSCFRLELVTHSSNP